MRKFTMLSGNKIVAVGLLTLFATAMQAYAQDAVPVSDPGSIYSDALGLKWILGFMIAILLMLSWIIILLRVKDPSAFTLAALANSVTGQGSKDELLDHNYDGIQELDNPMPAWLRLILWGSIIWGGIYLFYYHVAKMGPLMAAEYDNEVRIAEEEFKNVELPESEIIAQTSPEALKEGEAIYLSTCAACHGLRGEGGTGPNMTDAYWIHGGSIKEVFLSITTGYPDKGMAKWKDLIPSHDRLKIASYILSLQGTNPPNAKAPEGTLAGAAPGNLPADTTTVDSASIDSARNDSGSNH